jgi:hypothetical protein
MARHGWTAVEAPDLLAGDAWLIPITPIETEMQVDAFADALTSRFAGRLPLNAVLDAHTAAAELTSNAREHGRPAGAAHPACYVMCEVVLDGGLPTGIAIITAHFGRGFARGLERQLKERALQISEAAAIQLAFTDGVSSTGDPYRGRGLGYVRTALHDYSDGQVVIASQDAEVALQRDAFSARPLPGLFAGTLAAVHLRFA